MNQKTPVKNIIGLVLFLTVSVIITCWLILSKSALFQWSLHFVADSNGSYNPKVVGGMIWIIVAIPMLMITILLSKFFKK